MSEKPRWGGAPKEKCVGCGKTVYLAEMNKMEGQIWHINCLRCVEPDCNKKLSGANWGGFVPPNNSPYCNIHHKRLLQAKGSAIEFSGSTTGSKWNIKPGQEATPTSTEGSSSGDSSASTSSPSTSRFGGGDVIRCQKCNGRVYPAEMVKMDGQIWHQNCLRCVEEGCGKKLSGANWGGFVPPDNSPYCDVHHKRLLQAKGSAIEYSGSTTNSKWNIKPGQESTPNPSSGETKTDSPKPPPRWGGAPSTKCEKCGKTVYNAEMVKMEGKIFHGTCLRCVENGCNKMLTGANWGGFLPNGDAYCKIHLDRLIAATGSAVEITGSTAKSSNWTVSNSSG